MGEVVGALVGGIGGWWTFKFESGESVIFPI